MKFSSSVNAVLNRTFKPLLERLEDRLTPGETLGAALPLSSFVCPYLALLGSEATPGEGATATVTVSDTSSDSSIFTSTPSRYTVPEPDAAATIVSASTDSSAQAAPASGATQSEETAAPAPAGVVGGDSAYVTQVAADPAAEASVLQTADAQQALLPANQHTVSNTQQGEAAGTAMFTPATNSVTFSSPLSTGMENSQPAQTVVVAPEATAEPLMVGARQVAAPGSKAHPLDWNGTPNPPFTPAQTRHAYGFDQIANQGAGQTIYIVDAYNDPNIASDLATFDSKFGLAAPPSFTVHKMSSRIRNSTSWGLEESLDVEWAHAIAPQANIVLVEATSAANSALYSAVDWATNNGAHIVSMSWGGGDVSGENSSDFHFNHTGVSYVASAGDTGGVVEYPAASPYVLSVGGTHLVLDASGNYSSESAWTSGGGGASLYESEPGYQTAYGISGGTRVTPDVAYNADPNTGFYVYDSYYSPPGWYSVGGTSAGAPQWAALIALTNQSRSTPLSTNNLTSRTEYNAATGSVYGTNYHDVTTGSAGSYAAGPGYDKATGVGSPQANNLIGWLINNN